MRRWLICSLLLGAYASFGDLTAKSYVRDGLIAHWDGRIPSGGATEWIDLVNARTIALTGVTRSGHGLAFSGKATSYGFLSLADTKDLFEANDNLTVELVMKAGTGAYNIIKSTAASGVAIQCHDGTRYACCGSNCGRFQSANYKNVNLTLAVKYANSRPKACYANAVALAQNTVGVSVPGEPSGTWIGQDGADAKCFSGTIYAIRVYDRELTAEEIAQNSAVDAAWLFADDSAEYVYVGGSPSMFGSPASGYGPIQGLSAGAEISLTAPADELAVDATTHFRCTGWTFDGVDGVQRSGTETSMTMNLPCSGVFRWQFEAEELVTAGTADGGSVAPLKVWVAYGEEVTLTATPDEGRGFLEWQGDVPNGAKASNPLTLTVRKPLAVLPVFHYGTFDPDAVPVKMSEASGQATELSLDLSSVWDLADLSPVPIAYSSVGWDLADSGVSQTVDLELVKVGQVETVVLASDLSGRDTFVWTPASVDRAAYDLSHVVRVNGTADSFQTLTAHFTFEHANIRASDADILASVHAAASLPFGFVNNGGDEDVRWEPVGGAGEGLVAPFTGGAAAEKSVLEFQVSDIGTFLFSVRLVGGTIDVSVDGELRETIASAADWVEKSVAIPGRGDHVVRLEATVPAARAAFVKDVRWTQEDLTLVSGSRDGAVVDLREGVRAVSNRVDLLPFVYSHTNFVGVAGATDESIARVSVVRLAPDFPTDDLSLWTNAVAGTERVLCREADESSVVWRGKQGVWKAVFDILSGEDAVHTETAIFDMREFRPGFMLILR